MIEATQRRLTRHAAWLIMFGLLTGALVAGAMGGQVSAEVRTLLASHLNALLGAFWILGVAWSLPQLTLSTRSMRWMLVCLVGAQYGNWAVTLVKAFLHVSGVGVTSDLQNNAVFAVLNATVVIPSFAAAGLWLYGLRPQREPDRGSESMVSPKHQPRARSKRRK